MPLPGVKVEPHDIPCAASVGRFRLRQLGALLRSSLALRPRLAAGVLFLSDGSMTTI